MKSVRILLLGSLMISSFHIIAHTHEELEAQNILLRKQLAHEIKVAHEAVSQQQKENARLALELGKTWGWKKKLGTFVAGLAIGWIASVQGGQPGTSGIPGASTGRTTL